MNQYYLYRLERGLSPAEQRAADQRIGELAAALADLRGALGHGLCRRLGVLKTLGRAHRTTKQANGGPVLARPVPGEAPERPGAFDMLAGLGQ